jgi:DNA helicase-2/ATP-dependent DNA helicase PcrA
MDYLRSLNPGQRAAVTAPIGPVLVRAGAGSGKTRVLTLRIAYLIEQHAVPSSAILALTFTNKAAREMRERLRKQLGNGSRGLTTGTFHAICVRILREALRSRHYATDQARLPGYTADFSIYAGDDQLQLASDALDSAKDKPPTILEPADVVRLISRAKSRGQSAKQLSASSDPLDRFIGGCYLRYQKRLQQNNALDFDDLITVTYQVLSSDLELLDEYHARWKHLLVDEYQDTDPSQHRLVKLLSAPMTGRRQSLFVVGDAMQSIYGFRNADHRIISGFREEFPDAEIVTLDTNYRSRQPILDAAYAVIRHSRSVVPMPLTSAHRVSAERTVLIREDKDARAEAEQVAREIEDIVTKGRRYRDVAVLYRSKQMSRLIEAALRHRKIPYALKGNVGFYDRAVVKDMVAYLRCIANPNDSLSLTRIANVPARGLSGQAMETLSGIAALNSLPISTILTQPTVLGRLSSKAQEGARRLGLLLQRWRRMAEGTTPPDHLLADILEQSGYMAALTQRLEGKADELADARGHLEELQRSAEEHTSLSDWLQEIALMSSTEDDEDERDRVQLLTIHAAKGLEWPFVFVIGLEEGTLPHERSIVDDPLVEEERRLCYVALTRAAERLFLSWTTQRSRGKLLKPSRFLNDVAVYGRELVTGQQTV